MPRQTRHSALGIAALIVSACGLVMLLLSMHYAHAPEHAAMRELPWSLAALLGSSVGLAILALLLGLGSVLQPRRRRLFGIIALLVTLGVLIAQLSLGGWIRDQWHASHPPSDAA
ncbi:MAG: hypothetical protein ABS955_06830, partial [Stenotrophomonas maltophilia]